MMNLIEDLINKADAEECQRITFMTNKRLKTLHHVEETHKEDALRERLAGFIDIPANSIAHLSVLGNEIAFCYKDRSYIIEIGHRLICNGKNYSYYIMTDAECGDVLKKRDGCQITIYDLRRDVDISKMEKILYDFEF